jgi:glutamyl-tRNA synthetase
MGCSISNWVIPGGGEIFSMKVMEENFTLEDLRPVGPAFDLKKLEWMNGEYIRLLSNENLATRLSNYLKEYSTDAVTRGLSVQNLLPIVPLIKERMKKLSDFEFLAGFLFKKPAVSLEYPFRYMQQLHETLSVLQKPWVKEDWEKVIRKVAADLGVKAGEVFMDLRVAVTGLRVGPDLFDSIKILGEVETLARIDSVKNSS